MSEPFTMSGEKSGELFRNMVRSTSLYALGFLAQRTASILLLPFYTRFLSPADYGVMELLDLLATIFSLVVTVGRVGGALLYYYHTVESQEDRNAYVSTGMIAAVFVGAMCALPVALWPAWFSNALFGVETQAKLVQIFSLSLLGFLPFEVGLTYLRVQDLAGTIAVIQTVRIALSVALNVIFLAVLQMGVEGMVWSGSIIAVAAAAAMVCWTLYDAGIRMRIGCLKRLVSLTVPFGIGGIAEFTMNFGDRLFLKSYVGLAELGMYGLGYKLGMLIASVSACFFSYWDSQLTALARRPDGRLLIARTITYYTAAMAWIVIGLSVWARPLVRLLAAPEFFSASDYVPPLAVAYFLRAFNATFLSIFIARKAANNVALVQVVGMTICLGLYALLIPKYGTWGAVASTVVPFALVIPLAWRRAQAVFRVPYEVRRLATVLAAFVITMAVYYAANPGGFWLELAGGTLAFCSYPLVLFALRFQYPGETEALWAFVRNRTRSGPG